MINFWVLPAERPLRSGNFWFGVLLTVAAFVLVAKGISETWNRSHVAFAPIVIVLPFMIYYALRTVKGVQMARETPDTPDTADQSRDFGRYIILTVVLAVASWILPQLYHLPMK